MSACDHPSVFNTMCVVCGKVVPIRRNTSSVSVGGKIFEVTSDEAAKMQVDKVQTLQKNNKLALVLDLDHTLLHAVQVDGQTPTQTVQQNGEIHHLPIEDIVGGTVKHLVMKKRPHLDYFLEKANELFQITIYTAGTKRYAEAVVKVIDPTKKYISNRIVSRADGPNIRPDMLDKSLDKIFPKDSSMAVIIDDREDVWKGEQGKQLLLVRPYMYFYPGTTSTLLIGAQGSTVSEINNAPGPSSVTGQSPNDVKSPVVSLHIQPGKLLTMAAHCSPEYTEADDQLLRCLDILRDLHKRYYEPTTLSSSTTAATNPIPASIPLKRSVATLLGDMKKTILAGCTICFSGIIAMNDQHPEHHPLWKIAEALGAHVSTELSSRTTHLLTWQMNTKKVNLCLQTRSTDVWVLHPDWLSYCRWSIARADESTFLLVPLPPDKFPQPKLDFSPLLPITNDKTNNHSLGSGETRKRRLDAVGTETNNHILLSEAANEQNNHTAAAAPSADLKRIRISEKQVTEEHITIDITKDHSAAIPSKILEITTKKESQQHITTTTKKTIRDLLQDDETDEVEESEYVVEDDPEEEYHIPEEEEEVEVEDDVEGVYQEGDGDCKAFFEAKLIQDDGESYNTEDDFDGFSYAASLAENEDFSRERNGNSVENSTENSTDDEAEYLDFEQSIMTINNSSALNNNS